LNLRGYQLRSFITTLLDAHQRCGHDLTDWFGNYTPPFALPLARAA
jgi:hypothetical protein